MQVDGLEDRDVTRNVGNEGWQIFAQCCDIIYCEQPNDLLNQNDYFQGVASLGSELAKCHSLVSIICVSTC